MALYAPMFSALAAEVDGSEPSVFLQDAGRMAVVLRDLGRALPIDVLMVDPGSGWDLALAGLQLDRSCFPPVVIGGSLSPPPDSLEAARASCPTLEALCRLKETVSAPTQLGVVVTGALQAAAGGQVERAAWAQTLNVIVRLALEAGASLVLVQESGDAPSDHPVWAKELAPVWGTARFYQSTAALLLTSPEASWAEAIGSGKSRVALVVDEAAPDVLDAARKQPAWGVARRPGSPVAADVTGAEIVTTAGDLLGQVPVSELADTVGSLAPKPRSS